MKNSLKAVFVAGAAVAALSIPAGAQSVKVNALGSSALFLEAGLGASSATTGSIHASCVWSENTSSVVASDNSTGTALTDSGNAWVAWTPGTNGSCAAPAADAKVYAYLQTDSVVGDRCLFNANGSTSTCTIAYPTSSPASAGLILGASNEVALPSAIATALNAAKVNAAGTDIRPEDALFATSRATGGCGTALQTGSQYLGLGYAAGGDILSAFSSSKFHVVPFSTAYSYVNANRGGFTVTPVGAAPVLVVVNGNGATNGFSNSSITNISSSTLAKFLDGTYSYTSQVLSGTNTTGAAATVILREPLSGTYNTMEYNVPNSTVNQTSQDVGLTQATGQRNCNTNGGVLTNPLNIATASGGARKRAIGTGQALSQVISNANSLGYGFWSVANFQGFTSTAAPNAKYLKVDGIDPLLKVTATYTGTIPTSGSTSLANVDLHALNAQNGYPIWSLIRLVNIGSTSTDVQNLAAAAQNFVSFGTSTARPDFITPSNLTVVRSHFQPPTVTVTPANGHVGLSSSSCTAAEKGGDVGGVVLDLSGDSDYCDNNGVTTGHTGLRI